MPRKPKPAKAGAEVLAPIPAEVLDPIWIEQTEGAQFWMKVLTDLKTRGCQDILIAVTDGRKGDERRAGRCVSGDDTPDLHRPSDLPQCGVWELEGAQHLTAALRPIDTAPSGGRRERGPRRVRAPPMGDQISHRGRVVAAGLDARHAVLCVSPRKFAG